MLTLFWLSVFIVVYTYFGYPLLLFPLSLVIQKRVNKDPRYLPSVTLIITVHNEERRIADKIRNTLELDYPRDRLEVIFASDCSTDATDEIVGQYAHEGIKLVRSPGRGGKEFAQKCAIENSSGEVIVFTDVATILEKDAVSKIVANFSDRTIGCVSSEDRFVDQDGRVSGAGAYVRYELWLRSLESQVNSVVGLSGSFFAARREVCTNWPTDIPSDFNTLLNSMRAGYRGVSDPESVGIYTNIKDESREFERKVRTVTRGISALMRNAELLNPLGYGLFSFQLWSHKVMRWCVPFFLVTAFLSNAYLALRSKFYGAVMLLHILFYMCSYIGSNRFGKRFVFRIPFYFVQANRAIAHAWLKYITGERFVTWTPSRR